MPPGLRVCQISYVSSDGPVNLAGCHQSPSAWWHASCPRIHPGRRPLRMTAFVISSHARLTSHPRSDDRQAAQSLVRRDIVDGCPTVQAGLRLDAGLGDICFPGAVSLFQSLRRCSLNCPPPLPESLLAILAFSIQRSVRCPERTRCRHPVIHRTRSLGASSLRHPRQGPFLNSAE